jgi:hypothetical protein
MRYKVNVTFHGTASLEIEAPTVEAARQEAAELTVGDLARQGQTDIVSFKAAAREVTPASAFGSEYEEQATESGQSKTRPSGWYRPPEGSRR